MRSGTKFCSKNSFALTPSAEREPLGDPAGSRSELPSAFEIGGRALLAAAIGLQLVRNAL